MRKYSGVAKRIADSDDPGGEVIRLIEAIDELTWRRKDLGFLITQAILDEKYPNPVVYISVFTNKQTDFPADTEQAYIDCLRDLLKRLEG